MIRRRAAAAALLCGALPWAAAGRAAANWLPTPVVSDAPLLDHDGAAVRLPELLHGRGSVVSFFFAGCASVCPPQTALLREAADRWRHQPALRDVQFLAITVDPLGDGPKQLREYAQRFQLPLGRAPGWTFLTGAPASMRQVLAAFDVPLAQPDQHPSLVWLGDDALGRWTRTSGLNSPELTTRLFEALRR